jgi:RNase P protein component
MQDGHDYVLIGRRAALAVPFGQMKQELDAALSRIHDPERNTVQSRDESRRATGGARERSPHQPSSSRPAKRQPRQKPRSA